MLALFGAQNTETIALHFLWFTARSVPLSLAILGGALIGALLSLLVGLTDRVRRASKRGDLRRPRGRLEARVAQPQPTAASAEHARRVAP